MKKPILIFDLDGTIANTAPDILDSLNHSLKIINLDISHENDLMRFIGHGGKVMIERVLAAHNKTIDEATFNHLFSSFLEHYTQNIPGKSTIYPNLLSAIDRFTKAGFIHAVCTNKLENMSERLLEGLHIADNFVVICGQDSFAWKKPDPRHLLETIAKAGGDIDNSVMIGDSVTDISTAKAANIPVIAVDFGYSDKPIAFYEPDFIISDYDQLTLELVDELIKKRQP
jgi:phosphoglycolate phosphatase